MGAAPERQSKVAKPIKKKTDEPLTLQCPYCDAEITIPDVNQQQIRTGVKINCPECGRIITIRSG